MRMIDVPMKIPQLQEPRFNALADINDVPVKDLSSERIPGEDAALQNEVYREEVELMMKGWISLRPKGRWDSVLLRSSSLDTSLV